MKSYNHIIFDLDGTLTDPGVGITNSVMYALGKSGIQAKRSELYKFIGPPLRESFRTYYGFDETGAEQAVALYREYFTEKGIYENAIYPGITGLLESLKAAGKRLYIATSKPTEYSMRVVEHFKMTDCFDFISGSNMDGTLSDKSMLIEKILNRIDREEIPVTVMVGDRKYDIEGAKSHALDSVAVAYGYGELKELEESRPTYIAETIGSLRSFLLA